MDTTPANDTLETDTIVQTLNGMKLKWDTYPPQFIDMLKATRVSLENELLRRSTQPWTSPFERPIYIGGAKKVSDFPVDQVRKIISVTFYESGHYSIQGVHNDKGAVTAMRYYNDVEIAHAAGMEWMRHNNLEPVRAYYKQGA